MSNHSTTSRSYPPNYRNLGSQSPYPDPIQSSPGPTYPPQIDTHSKLNTYPAYDLNRHRSVSDASVTAPVLTMGNPAEREKARGEKANEGEYPEGWSREDEEAEKEFLKAGMFNWTDMKNWRFWIRKEWWYWYVAAVILGVLVALMALFHDEIVEWLTPMANWMQKLPAGWVIPIVIIFILSFPPLFGQEIVAVLCGVVWGLWVGFGIVAAGTFFGEVGNFYAFKYWCRSRAEKYERNNLNYAIMAHVVREGGFFFIFVVRLSAIPGHFTTAVFATCGMGIIVFSLACILTLPKQLIVVYLGVLFKQKEKSQKSRIISWTVLVIGFLITIWAVWYCYKEMNKVKLVVWRKQRMALAAKGVSIDPVTGKRRPSYREDPLPLTQARDEEEVLSPILQEHAQHAEAHYDADYHTAHPHHLFERRPSEADIAYNYGHHAPAPAHAFPEAHPAHQSYNIGRTHSSKSMHDHHLEAPIPTSFPVPGPAGVRTPDYSRRSSVQNASQHDQMSHDGPHGGQGYPDTLLSSGKGYHG